LERAGEVSVIAAACHAAQGGDGRVVVLAGRAGIGKSSLLLEGRRAARAAGFIVLTARPSDLEREFAFGVVRQLFERVVQRAPDWWAGAAEQARAVFDDVPAATSGIFEDVSQSVLHGLYWLVVNASADKPVLLSVDDLQLCDRSSLRFLSYLSRRLDGLPVVLLTGLRTAGQPAGDAALAELVGDPSTEVVEPQPLTVGAVAEVLRRRMGAEPAEAFAADCHRATGGNPLLLDELARAMQADGVRPDTASVALIATLGPRAVSRTVLARLAHAGPQAIAVAQALAVIGDWEGIAMLETVSGLDADEIESATRTLLRAEILQPGSPLRFVHPLVRDVVYRELSPVESERRHLAAAEVLRTLGRPVEQIAAHALALQPAGREWVVTVLREAALIAVRRGAADDALSYLRRALVEPAADEVRPRLLAELGMSESLANEPVPAVEHLRAAYELAPDPADRGEIVGVLSRMLIFTNPPDDAVDVLRRARATLPHELGDLDDALAAVELYAVYFGAEDTDIGRRLAAVQSAGLGSGPGARMLAASAAWDRALTGGAAGDCVELANAALADGVLIRADPWFMSIVAAGVLVLADDPSALSVWQQMLADGQRNGSQLTISGVRLWQGWNFLEWGALHDAGQSLGQYAVETARRGGQGESGVAYWAGFNARLLIEQGDLVAARAALDGAARAVPGSDGDLLLRRADTEVLLGEGQWQRALDAADRLDKLRRRIVNPAWVPSSALRSRALSGLERHDDALDAAANGVAAARLWGAGSTVGSALRTLATALYAAGSPTCISVFEEAAALLVASPARLELARAEFGLGSALRRRGQVSKARPHLARAGERAALCGATGLAGLAAIELRVAGGRPRQRAVSGIAALTPSERRAVEFAAVGRTNRAIAQELYVTPKTVEVHLSSAYRKLGITSRGELAAMWPPDAAG
jgi:DNA-binding CsgD family transcriptional regulator/tetratricopeptide (TPR) repeat protein